jgi:hypothetical protein
MATSMPNPQASAPPPQAGAGASPQGQQANPLQTTLGKIAMLLKQISAQNTSVQEPLDTAVNSIVQAIQMSAQAAPSAPQQPQAPMQS